MSRSGLGKTVSVLSSLSLFLSIRHVKGLDCKKVEYLNNLYL